MENYKFKYDVVEMRKILSSPDNKELQELDPRVQLQAFKDNLTPDEIRTLQQEIAKLSDLLTPVTQANLEDIVNNRKYLKNGSEVSISEEELTTVLKAIEDSGRIPSLKTIGVAAREFVVEGKLPVPRETLELEKKLIELYDLRQAKAREEQKLSQARSEER